jgi:type VI secretion system secreted protein Hcp
MGIGVTTGRSDRLITKVILLVLGLSLLAASGANAVTTDLFMQFEGIDGESTRIDHLGWSYILGVKWGVSAIAPAPGGGGGTAGKPVLSDLSWNQVEDKSFPPLFADIVSGTFIPTAHIDFTARGGDRDRIYFQMEFKDVFLTSLNLSGVTGADTTVAGSFAYDFIRMTYTPYDSAGRPLPPLIAEYSLVTHTGSVGALGSLYAMGLSGPTTVPAVPIPASLFLFGSGLVGLAGLRRQFSK